MQPDNTIADKDTEQELATLRQQVATLEGHLARRNQELAALRVSYERLRIVVASAHDWVYWLSPAGLLLYVSPSCQRITGYSAEEFAADRSLLERIIYPADRPHMTRYLYPDHPEQTRHELHFRIINRGGEERWIGYVCQPVSSPRGEWLGQHASNRDITERKQAEEALRQSEARLQAIFDNAAVGIGLTDTLGNAIALNAHAAHQLGYTPEALAHISNMQLTHPDDRAQSITAIQQLLRGDITSYRIEKRYMRKDGGIFWADLSVTPVHNGAGEIESLLGIVVDITERKLAEEALRQSETRLQAIFDNATVGISLGTPSGHFITVNRRAAEMLGYTLQEMQQLSIRDITYPDDLAVAEQRLSTLLRGYTSSYRLEKRYLRKDGSIFWGDLTVTAIKDAAGSIAKVVGILSDITERKLAEMQLQRANERLTYGMNWLRQQKQEATLLANLGDMLQSCTGLDEAYEAVSLIAGKLFPRQAGILCIRRATAEGFILEAVAHWGEPAPAQMAFAPEACEAYQQRHTYQVYAHYRQSFCQHVQQERLQASLCVPLMAQDDMLGILHLRNNTREEFNQRQHWRQLAEMVAAHVAMALNNLALRDRLQQQAIHDSLTGLYNRRYLDETLPRELQRGERHRQPVGIIILDIDHFKRFNDTYGHDAGDTLLRVVGSFLQTHTRGEDIACRYGGEEFVLMLPGASLKDTRQRAEQLRQGIERLQVWHQQQVLDTVTVSLGIAVFPVHGTTAEVLIKRADTALYAAKAAGRNCIIDAEHTWAG